MLYTLLYMSERTQVYLTDEQRKRVDEIAEREGKSMAQVIREAVTAYVTQRPADAEPALDATFGVAPKIKVPSRDEWARG